MQTLPVVASPFEVLVHFLPAVWRSVRRDGICAHPGLKYWHSDLDGFVGCIQQQLFWYDPRNIHHVFFRNADGVVRQCQLLTKGVVPMSLFEWRRQRKLLRIEAQDPAALALRDMGFDKKDQVIEGAKKATLSARRMAAEENERLKGNAAVVPPPTQKLLTIREADMEGPIAELKVEILRQ
jgi:hypothetical protein